MSVLKEGGQLRPKDVVNLESFFPEIEQIAAGKAKGAIRSRDGQLGVNILYVRGRRGIDIGDLSGGGSDTKLRYWIDDWLGADRCGESSLQLRRGGHARTSKRTVVDDAPPFLREKKECLFPVQPRNDNWAADGETEIVVTQWRTSESVEVVKEVVGGKKVVAEEFIGAAMKGIGARTGDNVDLASGAAPKLGVVIAAQDLEFSNGIDAGKSQHSLVGATVDVISSVKGPIILTVACAVY